MGQANQGCSICHAFLTKGQRTCCSTRCNLVLGTQRLREKYAATEIARFWLLVDRTNQDGCWIWLGRQDVCQPNRQLPYGRFARRGGRVSAHRFSYELAKGHIPAGLVIRHLCDNSLCVNPEHLILGTHRENNLDTVSRGRWRSHGLKGERHGASKITTEVVKRIRHQRECGVSRNKIARELGVCVGTVRDVDLKITWSHIQ